MHWSQAVDDVIAARAVDTAAVMSTIFLEHFFWKSLQSMLDGSDMWRCELVSWHWMAGTNLWQTAAPSAEPLPAGWAAYDHKGYSLLRPDAAERLVNNTAAECHDDRLHNTIAALHIDSRRTHATSIFDALEEETIPEPSITSLYKCAKSYECEAPLLLMHPWCCGGKGKCAASGASIASHVKHNCEECRAAKYTNRVERRALTKLRYQAGKVRCEAPSAQPLIFCFKLSSSKDTEGC